MSAKPKLISDPPPRHILGPDRLDDVAEAVLALTREVWVLTDRMVVMEKVMAANGVDLTAQIDAFEPDAACQRELDDKRRRLLATVLSALKADPTPM
jgi:hypothetical protein